MQNSYGRRVSEEHFVEGNVLNGLCNQLCTCKAQIFQLCNEVTLGISIWNVPNPGSQQGY